MSDESKFWLYVWSIAATVVIVLILSRTYYNVNYDNEVAKLIEAGNNPLTIQCAMNDSMGNNPTCVALAVK